MKKIILTALAVAGGIAFFTQGTHAQTGASTDVRLSIQGGAVTHGVTTGAFDFGTYASLDTGQTVEGQFTGNAYFWVRDLKGADLGYYTTVSVSDLSGQTAGNTDIIPATGVMIKVDSSATVKINGANNASVLVDSSIVGVYQLFTSSAPMDFIYRTGAVNNHKIGQYAAFPWLKVNIPAYLTPDTYQGTITYTLYENS